MIVNKSTEIDSMIESVRNRLERTNCQTEKTALREKMDMLYVTYHDLLNRERLYGEYGLRENENYPQSK